MRFFLNLLFKFLNIFSFDFELKFSKLKEKTFLKVIIPIYDNHGNRAYNGPNYTF